MRLLFLCLFFACGAVAVAADVANSIPAACRQIVVVTAPEWSSSRGVLRRLERERDNAPWRATGIQRNVLLGENGLAWGLGLHEGTRKGAERKREGDRRAPAGLFRLTGAFGSASPVEVAISRFPYRQITGSIEAVDDPESRFYNQIVQREQVRSPDWKSSERMAEIQDYELGIVVAHNPQNIPGAGSCIFLHQWRGKRSGTAGCTVLRAPHLLELVRWLDAAKHPVLIQLPRSEIPAGL